MYLEIITPDKKVFEGEVKLVQLPGSKGGFEILKNHAPIISTLEKGTIKVVDMNGNEKLFVVDGGVIENKANKIIVIDCIYDDVNRFYEGLANVKLNGKYGFIDKNGIWSIGSPNYTLNADLKSSNSVLVVSNIRFKEASEQQVGSFLRVANIYGDLDYVNAGTINTYITNQIVAENNETSVLANLTNISFAVGGGEVARINSNGFLGLGNPLPQATLDNSNASILRSTVKLTNLYPGYPAQTGFVLTTIDSAGTAAWQNISSITDSLGNSISIGNAGAPVALVVNGQRVFVATTTSNLIASGGQQTMTMDISGVVIAQQYRGTDDTINFTISLNGMTTTTFNYLKNLEKQDKYITQY